MSALKFTSMEVKQGGREIKNPYHDQQQKITKQSRKGNTLPAAPDRKHTKKRQGGREVMTPYHLYPLSQPQA